MSGKKIIVNKNTDVCRILPKNFDAVAEWITATNSHQKIKLIAFSCVYNVCHQLSSKTQQQNILQKVFQAIALFL
jgi:hypothetical protein